MQICEFANSQEDLSIFGSYFKPIKMNFLKLIRYQNLILLALMQLVFHFGFLKKQLPVLGLTDWQLLLLVLSTICIAGAGYLINAVFDKNIDKINNPEKVIIDKHISETAAYNYYIVLNVIGVGIGFYLSNLIEKPSFTGIFIVIAGTLYMYASGLKKNLLIGNILIALILGISVLIVGIFDLLPMITPENQQGLGSLFKILMDYAVFTFLINLMRGIIKDFENIENDLDYGAKSLPIVLGEKKSKMILSVLFVLAIALLLWYSFVYLFENDLFIAVIYIFGLILAPVIYTLVRLFSASEKKDYSHLSFVLKGVIFFGILTILVVVYNIELVKQAV